MDKIGSSASIDVITPSPSQILPALEISEYDYFGCSGTALVIEISRFIDKKSLTVGDPIGLIEALLFSQELGSVA